MPAWPPSWIVLPEADNGRGDCKFRRIAEGEVNGLLRGELSGEGMWIALALW